MQGMQSMQCMQGMQGMQGTQGMPGMQGTQSMRRMRRMQSECSRSYEWLSPSRRSNRWGEVVRWPAGTNFACEFTPGLEMGCH
jgi:hypothetical protein